MTIKTKLLNERVAEKLGWKWQDGYWFEPFRIRPIKVLPDFKNDLNAVFNYIWLELQPLERTLPNYRNNNSILKKAWRTKNPAKYISKAFLEMQEA